MPRKSTKKAEGESPGDDAGLTDAPLFDNADGSIASVFVTRDEPLEEGFLGKIPPDSTERDIFRRWGGGTYSLSARNETGKHIKGGHATVQIGGDPIWQSETFARKWKRMQNDTADAPAGKPSPPAGTAAPSVMEMLLLMDKQAEKARLEQREAFALREREAQMAHDRQLEILREEGRRRADELRQQAERLERDAREREERREKDAREERERSREWMRVMMESGKRGGDDETPMRAMMLGMKIARDAAGGEGGDGLVERLIAGGLEAVTSGKVRIPGLTAPAAPPAAGQPAPAAGAAPARPAVPRVGLTGKTAEKAVEIARNLQAQGVDPNTFFENLFTEMAGKTKPGAAPLADAVPTPPAVAAPPAAPPLVAVPAEVVATPEGGEGKATRAAGRATR